MGLEGMMGSGKTILMVRYLLKDHANGHKVFANFGLRGIDYEHLNVIDIMKNENLNDVSVGIDEITVFCDCRRSTSKLNQMISYFILQTRKRNCTLYFTTQNFSMCDKRLMEHCDIQILCDMAHNTKGEELEDWRHYTVFDIRNIRNIKVKRFALDISKYYDYYDTKEVIMPPVFD